MNLKLCLKITGILLLSIFITLAIIGCGDDDTGNHQDLLKYRFAFLGDSQVGYSAWEETKEENPSSTNIPQLKQNLIDIANSTPRPLMSFYLGDFVMNEVMDDGETLEVQLNAWQEVYENIWASEILNLIPVPGNHELVFYDTSVKGEAPNPGAFQVWLKWFSMNGYDIYSGNGPGPEVASADKLITDESSLTYSFNYEDIHFLIINTDTLTDEIDGDTGLRFDGWIPINWIEEDITEAQNNPEISLVSNHRHSRWLD